MLTNEQFQHIAQTYNTLGRRYLGNSQWSTTEEEIAKTLTFTDRESYLTWTASWKSQYKKLTEDIRGYKRARKTATVTWYLEKSGYYAALEATRLRYIAKAMLEVRKAGKAKSAQMRADRIAQEQTL